MQRIHDLGVVLREQSADELAGILLIVDD